MIRISRSVPSRRRYIHEGRKLKQQQGSRERSHNHRQYRGWTSQKRDIAGPRFPRAIVRYRLPMSVVFSRRGPQFPPRARYFLFIGRLIACPSPPSIRSRGEEGSAGSRNPQVQIVCIVRISDDISHYIKLWRVRSLKEGVATWIATLSPLATAKGERFLPPPRRSTISTLQRSPFVVVERQVLNFFIFNFFSSLPFLLVDQKIRWIWILSVSILGDDWKFCNEL